MLAITPGEPAGIGPDLVVQLAATNQLNDCVVIADPELLQQRAELLNSSLEIAEYPAQKKEHLTILPVSCKKPVTPGELDVDNGQYVVDTLQVATELCLSSQVSGLVTGPVQKSIINDAGIGFSGHTEFFQQRAGVSDVVMLLVAGNLRVALATTHLPLREVADQLSVELLERRLLILLKGLQAHFSISKPRVLVAGLNPHAGESGHLGWEEQKIIAPAMMKIDKKLGRVIGPLPADTLFTKPHLDNADAVFAMYHDQGLPVLKYAGFGNAVNVTLGLPFVRTSVDHGTALDLAGLGTANAGSFLAALKLARQMTAVS